MTFAPLTLHARNPSPMTGDGNNTYLLIDRGEAVLIDAGVGQADHLAELTGVLIDGRADLRTVVVTHGHTDHASGSPAIAGRYPAATFLKYQVEGAPLVPAVA